MMAIPDIIFRNHLIVENIVRYLLANDFDSLVLHFRRLGHLWRDGIDRQLWSLLPDELSGSTLSVLIGEKGYRFRARKANCRRENNKPALQVRFVFDLCDAATRLRDAHARDAAGAAGNLFVRMAAALEEGELESLLLSLWTGIKPHFHPGGGYYGLLPWLQSPVLPLVLRTRRTPVADCPNLIIPPTDRNLLASFVLETQELHELFSWVRAICYKPT